MRFRYALLTRRVVNPKAFLVFHPVRTVVPTALRQGVAHEALLGISDLEPFAGMGS